MKKRGIQISAEILKVEVNGQEKEMNRDLYELDALQRKELASTDMITVKNTQRGCGRRPDERIWRDRGTDVASE